MDKISKWTLTISAVSIMSGILLFIVPKSSQKNYFKVIVSIILIYSVMQPIIGSKGIDFNVGDFLSDNYQVSENLDKYALNSMTRSAEKAIEDLLETSAFEQKLTCTFKCECAVVNNEIVVKIISVRSLSENYDKDTAIDIVTDFGFDESVIIFEGE